MNAPPSPALAVWWAIGYFGWTGLRALGAQGVVPPVPTTFWPTSLLGYVGALGALTSLVVMAVGWGKMLAEFRTIDERTKHVIPPEQTRRLINEFEALREDISLLKHTMYGDPAVGRDGIAKDVHELRTRTAAIENRNAIADALAERDRGAQQAGGERRGQHRRREDRLAFGEGESAGGGSGGGESGGGAP